MSATLTTPPLRAHLAIDHEGPEPRIRSRAVPLFLNVDEAAELLRTTRRANLRHGRATSIAGRGAASSPRPVPLRRFARLAGPEARAIAEGVNGDERKHQTTPSRRVGRGHQRPAGTTGDRHRERRKLNVSYSKTTA